MSRIHNFNPGPSTLPLEVLKRAREELTDFQGKGMSVVEMSHRSPEISEVHAAAQALFREILGLPDNYKVLFLGGGATLQFSMVPHNLLTGGKSCDFTVTGTWAKKAYADARKVGEVNVVFDGKDQKFATLPKLADLKLDPKAAYLHLTSNETIGGIQWHEWPEAGAVPLVCDMSSDLLSRRLPLERFGIIYAGAQKNLGPAGVTLVIIRDDILERCNPDLTAYLSYRIHAEKDSMYNTPPVFGIYMMKLVFEWLKEKGGLAWAELTAAKRSGLIYGAMDASSGFYTSPVAAEHRSMMNIVFRMPAEDLEKKFIAEAANEGMGGLKGHRSVGGCRASIYNAMPVEGAEQLAQFMQEFARKNG